MTRKIVISLFVAILLMPAFAMAQQARNIELVDVPTANTLIKGEVRADIKFYPGGGILNRVYVGFFERLMIGGALNVNNLIGTGNVIVDFPPKFLGKVRITDDAGAVPAISIGYEGEGYMEMPIRGLFLAVTKEIKMSEMFLQLTGTLNTNEFREFGKEIDLAAGAAMALTREFTVSCEYDSIIRDASGHLNIGIGYFFDPIEIDIGIKYGMSEADTRLARILRIIYISYF